jgi:hypothetical protein
LIAQQPRTVSSRLACPDCAITVQRLVELGTRAEAGAVRIADHAVRTSDGRYIVANVQANRLLLFDAHGQLVRSVGREGEGPGEFREIAALRLGAADTVHVFDNGNLRETIYSPMLERLGERRLPHRIVRDQVFLLPDGQRLVNAQIRTPERIGLPLHLVDSTGEIVRSFGALDTRITRKTPYADVRVMALAPNEQVWTAYENKYVLELWSLSGSMRERLVREASWFHPGRVNWDPAVDPPPAVICGLRVDAHGLLWVLSMIPDHHWQRGHERVALGGGRYGYRITNPAGLYDSVLEVIDPATGQLLQSRRFDQAFAALQPDGLLIGARQDDDGYEFLDVWRIQWHKPS